MPPVGSAPLPLMKISLLAPFSEYTTRKVVLACIAWGVTNRYVLPELP